MSAFHEGALTAAAIFLILAAAYRASRQPKNTRPVTESTQPVTRRATTPCARLDCNQQAANAVHASGEFWWFCKGHALPYLTAPYDQERDITDRDFREVMDDARRITREASGGVA
jgi:hypothetical protein